MPTGFFSIYTGNWKVGDKKERENNALCVKFSRLCLELFQIAHSPWIVYFSKNYIIFAELVFGTFV
jgi:hypothetical protein